MTLRGKSAWTIVIVLVVSLCINSFFVGAQVMRVTGSDGRPPGGQGGEMVRTAGLARILSGLPDATHDHLRGVFEASGDAIPNLNRDLRRARRDVLNALRTEPLDVAALEEALDSARSRTTALQLSLHAIFVKAMAEMPPDMRSEAVEIWSRRR